MGWESSGREMACTWGSSAAAHAQASGPGGTWNQEAGRVQLAWPGRGWPCGGKEEAGAEEQVAGKRERSWRAGEASRTAPEWQDGSGLGGRVSVLEGPLWGGAATVLPPVLLRGSPYFLSSLLGNGLVTTWGRGCLLTPQSPPAPPPSEVGHSPTSPNAIS